MKTKPKSYKQNKFAKPPSRSPWIHEIVGWVRKVWNDGFVMHIVISDMLFSKQRWQQMRRKD